LAGTWLLHTVVGLHYVLAATLATQVSILWNFVGCELLVWQEGSHRRLRRLPLFLALNNTDLVVRLPLLALLVGMLGLGVGLATAITLVVAAGARYLVLDRVVYRKQSSPSRVAPRHRRAGLGPAHRSEPGVPISGTVLTGAPPSWSARGGAVQGG
jgi:dolichol-phosphate mannosyltransferase